MFLFIIFTILFASGTAIALQLQVLKPLQAQRPLIARYGSAYSWKISSSTFGYSGNPSSASSSLSYNVTGLPGWLSFSPSSLSLTGSVPSLPDSDSFSITITAFDGSTNASDIFTFLISSDSEPQLVIPLSQQITPYNSALSPAFPINPSSALPPYSSKTTATNGKAGLRVPPAWMFSFGFQGATFSPWPLFYTATLANGDPLPGWIRYDTNTFTFDGIAPDVDSLEIEILYMASDRDGYSTGAVDTFWVIIAAHELKLRDASVGIHRNVTVGSLFEVDLMDGEDYDPFMGELYWDAGPLPRWAVQRIAADLNGTQFLYNSSSTTLTGLSPRNQSGSFHGVPIQITDNQNLTLFTNLSFNTLPAFFQSPDSQTMDASGSIQLLANRSVLSSFDIRSFITTEGQESVRSGSVNLTVEVEPNALHSWFAFDQGGFVVAGGVPSDLDDQIAGALTGSAPTNATGLPPQRRKQHHFSRLTVTSRMLPSPTLERAISLSTSNLTPTSPSSSFPPSVPLSSSLPSTLNVTFRAHFLESRCVSKLHIRFDFTRNAICSSNSTVCQHSENDPSNTKHVKHLSLILGIIFVSLLAAFVIGLVWFMRKKAPSYLHFSAAKEEGKTPKLDPYVLKQEGVDDGTLGSDQLERGVGGRIVSVLPPSMAETRSFVSSGTRGESRAPTPSTLGVKVAARTHQEESNGNGSNTESSGSHYEDQSNIGARLNNEGMRGAACGGVRFSRLGSSAGSRSGSETGHHLAPPLTVQNQSSPYSIRSTSPTPSSATTASAVSRATISKQTFFAKLKNLGPPRPRDPSSSSSDEEPHTSRPSPKPSIFANVVPTIKESSLGSLLGLSGDDSTKKKAAIGKPRPLMPSLGAYLARDHAQQIARAAASKDIVTRQDSDSGSSFTGGTAIIYSMKNSPLPIDIEPPLPPAHGSSSVESLPNPYDLTTNEPDRVVASTAEVAQLIRQRSTNSAMPAAPSHDDTLSSSSTGTITTGNIGEWRHPDSSSVQKMDTGDIPRRRIDFGKPTDEATNDMRPPSFIQEATSPLRHSRLRSDGSADSVVVSTAALAVRSPMTGARLVPSPKPSVVEEHPPTSPPDPIQSQTKDNTGLVHKTRLVQFVHERQYDGSTSGENDDRTYGIYSTYQGKREISQKAVVSGTPPEAWEKVTTAPTNPILGTTVTKSGSGLAEKVKMLREQSRIFHEQRVLEANTGLSGPIVSPVEAAFFDDPTLAAGIRYIQSLSSNDDVSMSQARASPGHETGLALGGYSDEHASNGSIAGKEQIVQSGSRSHISQTQPSFIAYEPSPPRTEKRTPPRIPLPTPPAMQYFDLSESSSDSSSSSQGAGVVHHRPGLERILVGVNEPFNFPAPLHLPGSSPGRSSRVQVINHLKSAQKESNALTVVLWAEMEDGSPLPEWLGFDNQEAEFWGVPERGQQGGSLRVKVYLQEDGEVKEVGRFIIEIVGR